MAVQFFIGAAVGVVLDVVFHAVKRVRNGK